MVRFATHLIRTGHLPLTSWFPFLGLGSPQFLHYQSLPSILTAVIGLAIGPDSAFRWSLYILLSIWPVSVYIGARLFGARRLGAGCSAAMSPFLASVTGVGYEQHAYLWVGFGVWTQLWASLTLPLAWGLSWRAIRDRRSLIAPVALISLTLALHFETAYLALAPLLLWPFVAGAPLVARVRRAAVLLAGSLLASAWVIVPLLQQRDWAAPNEILRGTDLVNGYGAGRVLSWLITGRLLDHGRLPVITAFAAIGLVVACSRARGDPNARALLTVFGVSLLLSFGRSTFGSLVDVIPGSADIFFRRFMMGVQLSALILAGLGAAWSMRRGWAALDRATVWLGLRWRPARIRSHLPAGVAVAAIVALLTPAWLQLASYDRHNAAAIAAQRRADATQGAQVDRLIALVKADGGGRVYAGTTSNWGADFTVGAVPVFKYLESRDVDEVGYTLRTASLMTGPEYYFEERNPSDYRLFGVRFTILPRGESPPIPEHLLACAGSYCLWSAGTSRYVQVGRIVGVLAADRTDLGSRNIALLRSRLAQNGEYLRVAFGQRPASASPLPPAHANSRAGTVIAETDDLTQAKVTATVSMKRPGIAVLSSSFDPGWTATVDGRPSPTMMVAPALVAIDVPAGTHKVTLHFNGPGDYLILFVLSALTFAALLAAEKRWVRSADRAL